MPRNISRVGLLGGLLILAVAVDGCQRGATWSLAPVEGTVTKEGRPLQGVEVVFLADLDAGAAGPRARGITDESGRYRLRTDNGDDGAAVGHCRVCIHETRVVKPGQALPRRLQKEAAPLKEAQQEQGRRRFKETTSVSCRVPPTYGRPSETPLRVEVQPRTQVIDLDVK
jgi:hypothetical protein